MFNGRLIRFGQTGIRVRLIVLVLLTAAPFLAIIFVNGLNERNRLLAAALGRNAGVAQLLAARQHDMLVQSHALLSMLQRAPAVVAGGPDCRALMRQVVQDNPQFDAIGITDADGVVICGSAAEQPHPFADPAFFARVTAPSAPPFQLSGLQRSPGTARPVVIAALPLAGLPRHGMIFGVLGLDRWIADTETIAAHPHMQVTVADARDGIILFRRPADEAAIGRRIPDGPDLDLVRRSPNGGAMIGHLVNQSDVVRGFAPVADDGPTGLMVAVTTPLADAVADVRWRFVLNLAILSIAVLAVILADWAVLEFSLLRPLQAIQDVSRRLGAGDLGARVTWPGRHGRELRALGKTLNVTAGRLQRTAAETRRALDMLAQREAEFRDLADNTSDMIFRLDLNLVRRYVSPASRRLLGYMPEELEGQEVAAIIHPEDREHVYQTLQMLLAGTDWASIGYRLRHRDGRYIRVDVHLRTIRNPAGAVIGIVGNARDVTDRHDAAERLAASEARYRLLADYSTDLILELDSNMGRRYVSPACRWMLGYEPEELLGTALDFIHPDDIPHIREKMRALASDDPFDGARYRYRHKDGHYVWVEGRARRLRESGGYVVTVRDLTHSLAIEQRLEAANQRLEVQAAQDGLTGLANRRRFDETLSLEFRRAERGMMPLSLIMIDVDYFKRYNDTYGHQAGDACLQEVALAVRHTARRSGDLVARYGGEEMAVVLPDTEAAGAMALAEQIRRAVRALGREHSASPAGVVTISLGVATIFPGFAHGDSAILLAAADRALYQAKASGRDAVAEAIPESSTQQDRPGWTAASPSQDVPAAG